jgi:plasmid maintenance system antidote protein VapI
MISSRLRRQKLELTIGEMIRVELKRQGKNIADLAATLGMTQPTFRSRCNNEGTWTVAELDIINQELGISLDELLNIEMRK